MISKMKKLSVITLSSDADKLIRALQKLRCVNITEYSPPATPTDTLPETAGAAEIDAAVERALSSPGDEISALADYDAADELRCDAKAIADSARAIDVLSSYYKGHRGLFAGLDEVSLDSFEREKSGEAKRAVTKVLQLADRLQRYEADRERANQRALSLEIWKNCDIILPSFTTERTTTVAGILPPTSDIDALCAALMPLLCVFEKVSSSTDGTAVYLTALNEDYGEALKIISSFGFVRTTVAVPEGSTAKDEQLAASIAVKNAEDGIAEAEKALCAMSEKLSLIECYYDMLTTQRARHLSLEKLKRSERTVLLCGWIPEKAITEVTALLEARGDAYSFDEPADGDDVPVLLSNNAFGSSFEPVVSLYSLPAYGSFDPTFVMSIFYTVIFGLMFADVGYGAFLSLACFAALRLIKPRGSMRSFIKMFAICGVSMMISGILFGGYFGDLPIQLASNFFGVESPKSPAIWFDMVAEPMTFLIVSIAMGAVHLTAALGVKFYVLWSSGKRTDAVCDAGSWILLFIGAGVFFISSTAGLIIVGVSLLMLICTQGRHEKNIFLKIFKGIASLYDIVGYASDLLSYSRILALGLASAVIASVVNILGTMGGPTPVGIIVFVLAFAFGHLLNLSINLLGTFVHTSRLQYIEFFGKFYEDGGKPFEALTPESKYVIFK